MVHLLHCSDLEGGSEVLILKYETIQNSTEQKKGSQNSVLAGPFSKMVPFFSKRCIKIVPLWQGAPPPQQKGTIFQNSALPFCTKRLKMVHSCTKGHCFLLQKRSKIVLFCKSGPWIEAFKKKKDFYCENPDHAPIWLMVDPIPIMSTIEAMCPCPKTIIWKRIVVNSFWE